jgi:hypothetical protein
VGDVKSELKMQNEGNSCPHFCVFYGLTKVLEFGIVGFSFFEGFFLLLCAGVGRVFWRGSAQ